MIGEKKHFTNHNPIGCYACLKKQIANDVLNLIKINPNIKTVEDVINEVKTYNDVALENVKNFFDDINISYKDILLVEIKNQPDTDIGRKKAFWLTSEKMIANPLRKKEITNLLREFGRDFGEFSMVEMRGDFIDANHLNK